MTTAPMRASRRTNDATSNGTAQFLNNVSLIDSNPMRWLCVVRTSVKTTEATSRPNIAIATTAAAGHWGLSERCWKSWMRVSISVNSMTITMAPP